MKQRKIYFNKISNSLVLSIRYCHTAEVKKRLRHCIGDNLLVRLTVGPGVSLNGNCTSGMSVPVSNNHG